MESVETGRKVNSTTQRQRLAVKRANVQIDGDEVEVFLEGENASSDESINDDSNVMIEHMNIELPIKNLREVLGERLNRDFSTYEIWLQNCRNLNPELSLASKCQQSEGVVQINVELIENDSQKKINIVDVLRPTNEFLKNQGKSNQSRPWIEDEEYKKELQRLNIPRNPWLWKKPHVLLWIQWATRKFNLKGMKLQDWSMTGKEVLQMTSEEFRKKVPNDAGDLFWFHIQIMSQCRFVAVVKESGGNDKACNVSKFAHLDDSESVNIEIVEKPVKNPLSTPAKKSRVIGTDNIRIKVTNPIVKAGHTNSNQVQLWQFLLELLTDVNYIDIIQWIANDGQFKLLDPECVAELWGRRKNKLNMTYEKLSRALRYYYDGDLIAKVSGQRFVYKFVCDLEQLIGYSPSKLHDLVIECAIKKGLNANLLPMCHKSKRN